MELDSTFTASQKSIGIIKCWIGKFADGRAAVQKAMEMTQTPAGKAIQQGALARTWLYEGNLEEAMAAFDRAVQICTESGLPRRAAFYHLGRTRVSYEMGELDQAEAALADMRRLLESPEIVPYYRELYGQFALYWDALISAGRGDFDAALSAAEKHETKLKARQDPSSVEAHHGLLGLISTKRGEHEEAIAHFQQADDEDPFVLYHWATAESGAGSADKAADLFEKAASWNEDTWSYAFVRSKAMDAIGE
ncbi:MAG: tetratricopeptide repeat protein [Fidelibacterota bacterium]